MSIERQHRRRWPRALLFLAAVAPVAVYARWQSLAREAAFDRLVAHIAGSDEESALRAVEQLAAMQSPPVELLVAAAASSRRSVAAAAQAAIDERLQSMEMSLQVGRAPRSTAGELSDLCLALARQQRAFSVADQPWIAATTRHLLRLANRLPPGSVQGMATHADAILSAVALIDLTKSSFASTAASSRVAGGRPPQIDSPSEAPRMLEQTTDSSAEQLNPLRAAPGGQVAAPAGSGAPFPGEPRAEPGELSNLGSSPPGAAERGDWNPKWTEPASAPPPQQSSSPRSPAAFSDALERGPSPNNGLRAAAPDARDAASNTRGLLVEWLTAESPRAGQLAEELRRRGFSSLPRPLVRAFLSEDLQVRRGFIDELLKETRIDPRPWLLLCAEDPNADVRLIAVTVMATSNDQELLDKALEVALRDRDARIANLAARLRARKGIQAR